LFPCVFVSQAFGSPVRGGFEKIPSINPEIGISSARKPSVEKKEESTDFDHFPLSQHKRQQGRSSVSPANGIVDLSQIADTSDEDDTRDIKCDSQRKKNTSSSNGNNPNKYDNFLFPSSQKK
jgi:hypothetical protein